MPGFVLYIFYNFFEPTPGDDVYLSIDVKVQYKAEEALQAQLLNNFEGREGAAAGSMVETNKVASASP